MGIIGRSMNYWGFVETEEVVERENVDSSDDDDMKETEQQRKVKGNVVSLHSQKNSRLVLSEPRSYEDTQMIADHLRSRRAVVVNLQRVRAEQAVRIVDFLSGTVYALNGSIQKIGPNIFVCTPDSVEIQGSISDIIPEQMDQSKSR